MGGLEGVDFFASEPENWLFRVVPIGLHGAARIIRLQHCAQTLRRVLGKNNPQTLESENMLAKARMKLAAEEARTGLAAL